MTEKWAPEYQAANKVIVKKSCSDISLYYRSAQNIDMGQQRVVISEKNNIYETNYICAMFIFALFININ